MKFRDFLTQLSKQEFDAYAQRAGTTSGYLKSHLYYSYKEPRKKLRKALSAASNGKVSEAEVLEHFGFTPVSDVDSLTHPAPQNHVQKDTP